MLLHLPTTTSTMDVAKQLVLQGDSETTIVMADEQTAARGRHNRPWLAFPPPHGFAATFILRPAPGPHLPLVIALALYDALLPYATEQSLRIKWPNDLLLNGRKLAGILCENIAPGTPQAASLVGIGLNLTPPAFVPETFKGTFLLPANATPILTASLANAIAACITPLLGLYESQGWSTTLHNSYLQRCATIGQSIRWKVPNSAEPTELTGLARGLTPSGHLEMVDENGTVHVIHSGEIFDRSHENGAVS